MTGVSGAYNSGVLADAHDVRINMPINIIKKNNSIRFIYSSAKSIKLPYAEHPIGFCNSGSYSARAYGLAHENIGSRNEQMDALWHYISMQGDFWSLTNPVSV